MNIIIKNLNSQYFQNKANFIYAYILFSRNLDWINVKFWFFLLNRAENFRIVDIEINAWSSHFLNIKTDVILYLYPEKSYNSTNQSRVYKADKFEILRGI